MSTWRKHSTIARPGNRDSCPVAGSRSLRFESCEPRTLLSAATLAPEVHATPLPLGDMLVVSSLVNDEGGWITDQAGLSELSYSDWGSSAVLNSADQTPRANGPIVPGKLVPFSIGDSSTTGPMIFQLPLSEDDGVAARMMPFRPIAGPEGGVEGGVIPVPTTVERAESPGPNSPSAAWHELSPPAGRPSSPEVQSSLLPDRTPLEGIQTRVLPLDVASVSGRDLARGHWDALAGAGEKAKLAAEAPAGDTAVPAGSAEATAEETASPDSGGRRPPRDSGEEASAHEGRTTAAPSTLHAAGDLVSDVPAVRRESAARDAALALWPQKPLPVSVDDDRGASSERLESSTGMTRFYRPLVASALLVLAGRPALRRLQPSRSRQSGRLLPADR